MIRTVKRDWGTRHMSLTEIQCEARLGHVSKSTVLRALHERGLKAYREEFKFILTPENKLPRLLWCQHRKNGAFDKEWANYGFTDEMSIEVGGTFGVSLVWRENWEQWVEDCVGAKKKQGAKVMCWGMIGYGWKVRRIYSIPSTTMHTITDILQGPFHVWCPETKAEREQALLDIAILNKKAQEEEDRLNKEWKNSLEWQKMKKQEQ